MDEQIARLIEHAEGDDTRWMLLFAWCTCVGLWMVLQEIRRRI